MEWTNDQLEDVYRGLVGSIMTHAYAGENTPIQIPFGEEEPSIFKPKGGDANCVMFQKGLVNGNTYPLRFWDGSTFNVRLTPIVKSRTTSCSAKGIYSGTYKHYVVGNTGILNFSECCTAVRRAVTAFAQRVFTNHGAILEQAADWMNDAFLNKFGWIWDSDLVVSHSGIIKYEQDDTDENYHLVQVSRFEFCKAGMADLSAFDMAIGFAEALSNTKKIKNGRTFSGNPNVYKWVLHVADCDVRFKRNIIPPPPAPQPTVAQW